MIIAIIQARMGSSRLPKKIMLELEGKTALERVIERVRACRLVDDIVIATTTETRDAETASFCEKRGIKFFRGSENDVLDRFYRAALHFKADQIVRVTSDCPMIDPAVIEKVISLHLKTKADYTSNVLKESFPDGQDVEILSFGALKKAWESARLQSEREHVTTFIRNHPEIFKLQNVENGQDLSSKRWTLDQAEDYEFIKSIYKALVGKSPLFGMDEVLDYLRKHPELEKHNAHITRNEGYLKSLKQDRIVK